MDVFAGGAVVVVAVAAVQVIDGLAWKGFGRESSAGDDDLAVFVLVPGSCGLESSHFFARGVKRLTG
jgi:hypothetical protein